MAFTEAAGTQTDLQALIRQAIKVLEHRFPGSSIGYYEEEDGLWKARVWSEDVLPELAAMIAAGLPAETPMFAHMLRTRQPVFTEAWDAVREQINLSEEYGAVANYPLVVNGELHWLLSIGLRGTRTWSEVDQALVRAVGRSLNLALDRAVQTRQLDEERAALEAFTRFTEEVGSETDVEVLVQRAITLLADTCSADTVYLKCDGDLFKATVWNSDFDPALLTRLQAGFPLKQSNLALILRQNTAAFIDHWDAAAQWIEESLHLRAVAGYPYFEEDQLESVLLIGCRTSAIWDERTKGIIRAVGHSLDLALDRAHQTEALKQKNAELAARTQALEGFALLTREFSLEHDPVTQVGRAQELILSLMPSGISTYYELQGDHWDLRSHRGTFHDPALLEALQAGVPRGSILNIERPAATGQPYYQDHFDASTSMVAQKEFEAIGTSVGLPILVTDQVQGVLIVGLYQARPWSAPERAVLETVAHSLGLVLERSLATRALLDQRDALDVQTASLAAANEELQAFSYSVSHDLRTPVRHMLGFLGLARKNLDGRLDERSARYLDVVEQAGTQMNTLIDALMDLSRAAQHTVRVQVVDLDELMAQIQAVLLPDLLSRNIQWEVAPLPSVWGDADALKQVLTQLTENAVKFTRTRDPAVIRVWAEDQGDAWGVFVQDNGLGFDPRYQDRLFNMFQRLHSVKEAAGTGVGLASVRRLILKHGGQVFATGQVGEGATFGFTLPKTTLAQP